MTKCAFNENDLSVLFDLLRDSASLMTTAPDGTINYAKERFCELMGYKLEEVIGQNPRMMNSGFHDGQFFKSLWNTVQSGKSWHGKICNKKKDGSLIWLNTFIGPVFDKDLKIEKYILVRFDVTDEVKNQLLTKDQAERLVFSSKMAALGEMAAGMAHEINNYLAIISGKASVVNRQIKSDHIDFDKVASDLEKVQNSVSRITKIIDGLRRFSRNAEGDPMQAVPIQQILEDTLSICQDKFKKEAIEIKINFQTDDKISVLGRPAQLSEIFINLVSNSYDAIQTLHEKWVEILVEQKDNFAVISVTDSGNGIPAPVLKKLMLPFFTTKEVGKGTGLGLSISKKIVQEHHGKFYYNEKSPRTQFVVEIPIEPLSLKKVAA